MAKTTTIRTSESETETAVLSNEEEYKSVLETCDARCVVDQQSRSIYSLQSLQDGATYRFKRKSKSHGETFVATAKREVEETVHRELAERRRGESQQRVLSFVSKSHALLDGRTSGRISFRHDLFF